jgi:hypothetical protein
MGEYYESHYMPALFGSSLSKVIQKTNFFKFDRPLGNILII